jgi:hypothetical protein
VVQIVGLMGAEQAGKSTAAQFLRERGFVTVSFASPLKRMLAELGLDYEQLHGNQKEVPCAALCGQTPRFAMQTLGTEWGRVLIGGDIWVEALRRDILAREQEQPGGRYLVEDVRFGNEVRIIRELGGEIWLVRRPEVEPDMSNLARLLRLVGLKKALHPSSTGWAEIRDPERIMFNMFSHADYLHEISATYDDWRSQHYWRGEEVPDELVPAQVDAAFDGDDVTETFESAESTAATAVLEAVTVAAAAPATATIAFPMFFATVSDAIPEPTPEPVTTTIAVEETTPGFGANLHLHRRPAERSDHGQEEALAQAERQQAAAKRRLSWSSFRYK